MTLQMYQANVCEECFTSSTSFVTHGLLSPVDFPDKYPDDITTRGLL